MGCQRLYKGPTLIRYWLRQNVCAAECYVSKLVAAMDRQHPRDLFDVHGCSSEGDLPRRCMVTWAECAVKSKEVVVPVVAILSQGRAFRKLPRSILLRWIEPPIRLPELGPVRNA
jgi:hypothetical protein